MIAVVGWRCDGRQRDVGGADAVAVGDRGQPLDVGAEQPLERPGLGLAQFGELLGDVGDRAVVLADLHAARRRAPRAGFDAGGVALAVSATARACGPLGRASAPRQRRREVAARAQRRGARRTRARPPSPLDRAQEAQRRGGQFVVGVREGGPAGVGDRVGAGRAAAAALDGALGLASRPAARRRPARRGGGGCRRRTVPAGRRGPRRSAGRPRAPAGRPHHGCGRARRSARRWPPAATGSAPIFTTPV